MSKSGSSYYCDYCGEYIGEEYSTNYGHNYRPPANAVTKRTGLIFMKVYCSKKCKNEDVDVNDESKADSSTTNATHRPSSDDIAELARIQWEKDQIGKQKEQEEKQEEADEKANRESKANELKKEGKILMAFVTLNQENILIGLSIGLVIVLALYGSGAIALGVIFTILYVGGVGFGVYKYFKEMFAK